MPSLTIWVDNIQAASLYETQDQFSLCYTEQWIAKRGFAFSPHLPINVVSKGAAVRHFFSNLLPEGQVLEGLTTTLQISKYDVFGILGKIGQDCAGALVLLDEGTQPDPLTENVLSDYILLEDAELNRRILESNAANTPVLFWENTPRMSLAGVQNKLGVYMDDLDRLYLPKSAAPTSHILKPDSVEHAKHPAIAANEYFCMVLAKAIGLNVPDVLYKTLPTPVYLVQRYDRIWTSPYRLVRSHQIDGCQALNLPPTQKYEQEYAHASMGATIKDILALAELCVIPAIAQKKLLQWLLFNYLIGNSDAHAKNIAFLINPYSYYRQQISVESGMQVAPYYDLVSGAVYGYQDMAQSIGDETNFALIGYADWKKLSQDSRISFALLQKITKDMLKNLRKVLPKVSSEAYAMTNQSVINKIVCIINTHSEYLEDSLKLKTKKSG